MQRKTPAGIRNDGGGSAIWLGIVLALAIIAVVVYFFMRYKNQHKHD
jgi:flagellar basal body-associated protein FliL